MSTLTIGQLGKAVGLPPKTIRFYEDINLISSPKRANNGYRLYTTEILNELEVIKHARDLGLPIPEIKKLMRGCGDNCEHSKAIILSDIEKYVQVVEQKQQELNKLKTQLTLLHSSLEKNKEKNSMFCCNILTQLKSLEKGGDK